MCTRGISRLCRRCTYDPIKSKNVNLRTWTPLHFGRKAEELQPSMQIKPCQASDETLTAIAE